VRLKNQSKYGIVVIKEGLSTKKGSGVENTPQKILFSSYDERVIVYKLPYVVECNSTLWILYTYLR